MNSRVVLIVGLSVMVAISAVQFASLQSLKQDVAVLRQQLGVGGSVAAPVPVESSSRPWPGDEPLVGSGDLNERLARVEMAVEKWDRAADLFMDRGMLPPSPEKLAEFRATFLNSAASARDRLGALRMLRRNNAVTPEILAGAVAWLGTMTDSGEVRSLLQGLEGLTDPSLFETTYALASSTNRTIQFQAMQNLAAFRDNPRAADLLWNIATTGEGREVRGRAAQLLADSGYSAATMATWQARALDASAPLEQRALALRVMSQGDADIGPVASSVAQAAQSATDKAQFLEWMNVFDTVNNPAFLAAVVQGVQSADVEVRRRAADTLRDYRSDPTALQWLQYLAQSDPDERVRNEAIRGLGQR